MNLNFDLENIQNFVETTKKQISIIIILIIIIIYYTSSNRPKHPDSDIDDDDYPDIYKYEPPCIEERYNNCGKVESDITNNVVGYDNPNYDTSDPVVTTMTPINYINNLPINESVLTPRTQELVTDSINKTNVQLNILNTANVNNDNASAVKALNEINNQTIKFDGAIKTKQLSLPELTNNTNNNDIIIESIKNKVKLNSILTNEKLKKSAEEEKQIGNINKSLELTKEAEKH